MNEGHSAFLQFERLRAALGARRDLAGARSPGSRRDSVFTTHTPVPAGNEVFDAALVRQLLRAAAAREIGVELEALARARQQRPRRAQPAVQHDRARHSHQLAHQRRLEAQRRGGGADVAPPDSAAGRRGGAGPRRDQRRPPSRPGWASRCRSSSRAGSATAGRRLRRHRARGASDSRGARRRALGGPSGPEAASGALPARTTARPVRAPRPVAWRAARARAYFRPARS